ncbi:hypothetical protein KKH3_10120 [Pectobacterium actinidiae]|nr:hypothetical protein KKH3_10120 [Pectobacterium actinidiae]
MKRMSLERLPDGIRRSRCMTIFLMLEWFLVLENMATG